MTDYESSGLLVSISTVKNIGKERVTCLITIYTADIRSEDAYL